MRKNERRTRPRGQTHEGGTAVLADDMALADALRMSLMACLLFESTFYEAGESIADRIRRFARACAPGVAAALAREARSEMRLRHAPLLVVRELAQSAPGTALVGDLLRDVIQRADELGEFLALYWDGVPVGEETPLSAQVKRGLDMAIRKFDEYQLAKYDKRRGKVRVTLLDVLRLVHPRPDNLEQAELWRRVRDGELATPDTWETELSAGKDKRETFERLIREGRLGYMALLRNLRNMDEAGVDKALVDEAILARKGARVVLPFRFVSAYRAAPGHRRALDEAFLASVAGQPELPGTTAVLVDTSVSMQATISDRSQVCRYEAAAALAAMVNGDARLFSFASDVGELEFRRGLACIDAIEVGQFGHGTNIGMAVRHAQRSGHFDRIIVVTDMQSHDRIDPHPGGRGYMVNVAPYDRSVAYGTWTRIDGFSEQVLRYITAAEQPREPYRAPAGEEAGEGLEEEPAGA